MYSKRKLSLIRIRKHFAFVSFDDDLGDPGGGHGADHGEDHGADHGDQVHVTGGEYK